MIYIENPELAVHKPLRGCELQEIAFKALDVLLHYQHAGQASQSEQNQQSYT